MADTMGSEVETMRLEDLFDEVEIGRPGHALCARNHFVRSATYEGKALPDGTPTEAIKDLYCALADGGVGTIITSYTRVAPYDQPAGSQLAIFDDATIPAYAGIVDAVHARGARIVMQLVHGSSNRQAHPDEARVLGPSAMEHPASGIRSQAMDEDDLRRVPQLFAAAARRAQQAGFDGVQIHCAHGYLLAQFISPLFNHRTDAYGGSWEGRVRLVREVLAATRAAVGEAYPVWIKMNSSDEEPGGLTREDFLAMACQLAADGIDAIEVSGERWSAHAPADRAYYAEAAEELAGRIEQPVILTGGIRALADVAGLVQRGRVNLFGLARPLMKNAAYIEGLRSEL